MRKKNAFMFFVLITMFLHYPSKGEDKIELESPNIERNTSHWHKIQTWYPPTINIQRTI